MHAERAARLRGARHVQNGAQRSDALFPRGGRAVEERLQQRQRLTATIRNGGDGTKKPMRGEEIGAHHLCAATAAPPALMITARRRAMSESMLNMIDMRMRICEAKLDGFDGDMQRIWTIRGEICEVSGFKNAKCN